MKLQNLTLQQLKEIVDGAPDGATHVDLNLDTSGLIFYKDEPNQRLSIRVKTKWLPSFRSSVDETNLIKLSDIRTRITELEPKQKYDWSNVPDVVNWLATDKDGDCAWGFLEEPVIELEDEEWRPVAPYTEIYINGSNGTVAAYKGDWQESLEQRKFKIGDRVCFIRNLEPFQWGAKAKIYEVVDVADNLPTSTDQRVWLDTTASSPHLSRNLCLATAIGQVGIEDLPIHGEPISSEIITNVPVIDELEPVFKVGDRVVFKQSIRLIDRNIYTVISIKEDICRIEKDSAGSYFDAIDLRHATPSEIEAGHRIDSVSAEMASPCPASDSATNQAEMDLRGNKTDSITERLNPAKCGKVNPSLAYDELCSPAPMVDGQLHAPIGQKHDQGKPRYSLIPSSALASIVDVLEYGATKYAPDGWKHVENARERYYNASMRHIQSWWSGEQNDPETNLPHLAHAVCSLMFLMWLDGEQGE